MGGWAHSGSVTDIRVSSRITNEGLGREVWPGDGQ